MKRQVCSASIFGLLAIALSCCGGRSEPSRALVGCERGTIEYKDRALDEGEALKLIKTNGEEEKEAMRVLSSLMASYFNDKASLCDLYVQGELSELEYNGRKSRLAERLAASIELNQAFPAHQVRPEELPLYTETLSKLEPGAKAQTVEFSLLVVGEGREIDNGGTLFGGDELRLIIDVDILAYLYVMMIDSSGAMSLLYPTRFGGGENPVQGRVEIPRGESVLVLDENQGKERFLVFVQTEPAKAVEALLSNRQTPTFHPASIGGILWRVAKSRMSLTKNRSPKQFFSHFGQASTVFEIDHR
jgi:hypothetical protein